MSAGAQGTGHIWLRKGSCQSRLHDKASFGRQHKPNVDDLYPKSPGVAKVGMSTTQSCIECSSLEFPATHQDMCSILLLVVRRQPNASKMVAVI